MFGEGFRWRVVVEVCGFAVGGRHFRWRGSRVLSQDILVK